MLKVPDWDAFRDPDQLTYRKYVTIQDSSETYIDATLQEFSQIGPIGAAPDFLQTCLIPSRYLAHGLQMMSGYLQQMAPSTYVGNCAAFQAADHLRRVQPWPIEPNSLTVRILRGRSARRSGLPGSNCPGGKACAKP
jgi:hypothetical protein